VSARYAPRERRAGGYLRSEAHARPLVWHMIGGIKAQPPGVYVVTGPDFDGPAVGDIAQRVKIVRRLICVMLERRLNRSFEPEARR
jgi:hypothetical protein